jgi:hypothetical protein
MKAARTVRGRGAPAGLSDDALVMDTGFADFWGSLTRRSLRGRPGPPISDGYPRHRRRWPTEDR